MPGVTSFGGFGDYPPVANHRAVRHGTPRRSLRVLRVMIIVSLVVVGLGGAGAGGFELVHELTRGPTNAELRSASTAEVAQRWRELTAGKIFPASVRYPASRGFVSKSAHLVGIAPQSTCAAAASSAVASLSRRHRCEAVLRATYTDQSGSQLATVGVAVMPSAAAARALLGDLAGLEKGVHPVGFSGTIGRGFKDSAVAYTNVTSTGLYVVMDASGFADGRHISVVSAGSGTELDFADNIAAAVLDRLTKKVPPCEARDVRC